MNLQSHGTEQSPQTGKVSSAEFTDIGVVVIGGGIVGLCIASFLAQEGVDVACIDDGRHAGSDTNAGSLHVQMQSRMIRLFPQLVPAIERALPLYPLAVQHWQALAGQLDDDIGLQISGGIMVAETPEQLRFLEQKCRREQALGLDVEMLGRAELDHLAPYLQSSAIGAELCPTEGKVDPLRANAAIRREAAARGVAHLTGTFVRHISRRQRGFHIVTDRGVIRTERLVLAAGAGSAALANDLGLTLPTKAEPLHMNVTEQTSPLIEHLVQHSERPITIKQNTTGHIVIGGGWPARAAHRGRPPAVQLDSLIGNVSLAQHLVPAVGALHLIRTWAGINTTLDGISALGPVDGTPNLFVAIPGDAGYTLGPLCARLIVDTMLGRRPEVDIAPYSPMRFSAAYSGMAEEMD